MADDLRADMESLRSLAPRLNSVTDQATAAIKAADGFLASLSIGVPALSVHFKEESAADADDEDSKDDKTFWYLAYGRAYFSNDKFTIHVARNTERPNGIGASVSWETISENPVQWSSLTRADKLKAFGQLPELLRSIVRESTALVDSADQTHAIVSEMMEAIKGTSDEGKAAESLDDGGVPWEVVARRQTVDRDAERARASDRAATRVAEIRAEKEGDAAPVRRRRS